MKNLIPDLVFLSLVSGVGFILPWWSVFIICFFWAYLELGTPSRIFVCVFISFCVLIASLGHNLIQVLKVSNLKYAMIPLSALLFALVCFCVSQAAHELNKILQKSDSKSFDPHL